MNFKNLEGQTARWIEILGIYDLEVEHHRGRTMEMQIDFPTIPVRTGDIVSTVRRKKNAWTSQIKCKMTAKGTK